MRPQRSCAGAPQLKTADWEREAQAQIRLQKIVGPLDLPVPGPPPQDVHQALNVLKDFQSVSDVRQHIKSVFDSRASNNRARTQAWTMGALAFGEILYLVWRTDPTVVRAADFSRLENIRNMFDFSVLAKRWSKMPNASAEGLKNSLRGYTAEQFVLSQLIEGGHSVHLPETSNNPGADLFVDGQPFQVKSGGDLSILRAHFQKYPDHTRVCQSGACGCQCRSDMER